MRTSNSCDRIIGPNGMVPFLLVKQDDTVTVAVGHAMNAAGKVGAHNRATELLIYMINNVTGMVPNVDSVSKIV
ncbi:MAG: hypothetical protein ACO3EW_04845 [Candidatus Nanopelagicaceae bacterium]